jgi:type IV pilus assembly protein PilV
MNQPVSKRPQSPGARDQRGSFILEALIAILIFSFGVLGIVALQAQSLKATNESQYRAEAVYLANSLLATMWSDNFLTLKTYYDKDSAQPGYTTFATDVAAILPGGGANPPDVQVLMPGDVVPVGEPAAPSTTSATVMVRIFWQQPGEALHEYMTYGVIGKN